MLEPVTAALARLPDTQPCVAWSWAEPALGTGAPAAGGGGGVEPSSSPASAGATGSASAATTVGRRSRERRSTGTLIGRERGNLDRGWRPPPPPAITPGGHARGARYQSPAGLRRHLRAPGAGRRGA